MGRQYRSNLRAGQSKQTRLAIIEAGLKLFLKNGYAETTLKAIAREAGVADRTVYVAFKDKTAILMAIADHAFYGAADPQQKANFVESVSALPSPSERLRFVIHQNATAFDNGLAALAHVILPAVQGDPRLKRWVADMIDLRHKEWRSGFEVILGRKLSRNKTAHEKMVDELEAIHSVEVYWILAVERGWPQRRYEDFTFEMSITILERYGFSLK